jgi:hypothetical protein
MRMRFFGLCAIGILAAGTFGCSGKPSTSSALEGCLTGSANKDCQAKADVRLVTPARSITDKSSVDVQAGGTAVGGSVDLEFHISNTISVTTAAVLRISEIALTPLDNSGSYSCVSSDGTPCNLMTNKWLTVVPAGAESMSPGSVNEESFRIHYKKVDGGIHEAKVCVKASGDPGLPADGLCFTLATKLGKPNLVLSSKGLDFGHILTGKTSLPQTFSLLNSGDAPLVVSHADLKADAGFALDIGDAVTRTSPATVDIKPALTLDPGKSTTWSVTFTASDTLQKLGNIEMTSNDPAVPLSKVNLTANANVPCLKIVQSPELSFGAIVVGQVGTQAIDVSNCGSSALAVTAIHLLDGANPSFALDFGKDPTPSVDAPLAIAMNGSYKLHATYTPAGLSEEVSGTLVQDIALLEVASNAEPRQTKLTGVGVISACPKAIITIKEGEEVVPQTVLHLTGEKSHAANGSQVAKYKWTVKKQPVGSTQKFVPNAAQQDVTFVTNASGEYDFCLSVTDDKSVQSCNDACTTVIVAPSDCLHAELLWHTPLDPDETDPIGADVDLHLAHQLANQPDIDCDGDPDPWFDTTFDCFWFANNAHWGVASTMKQSPKLDLDDTDGAGPENMSLPEPEGTVSDPHTYALGVHYWNDKGFGHSWAIVRVYVCGTLAAEYNQPHPDQPAGDGIELKALDMWYVGKINWPNQGIGGTGPVMTTCYQSGDACIGKKTPSDPAGGKMWQTKGDWCITPCYISGNAPTGSSFCGN